MGTDGSDRKVVKLMTPSDDKPKGKDDGKEQKEETKNDKMKGGKKRRDADDDDMSPEDRMKKEELDGLVAKVVDIESDESTVLSALGTIASELQSATSSMTSVPKPLKFLRPHFDALEEKFDSLPATHCKRFLADILSVLATTIITSATPSGQSPSGGQEAGASDKTAATTEGEKSPSSSSAVSKPTQETSKKTSGSSSPEDSKTEAASKKDKKRRRQLCLYYRLQGSVTELSSWGQEYIRNLSGEIGTEYGEIQRRRDTAGDADEEMAKRTSSDGDTEEDVGGAGATPEVLHALVDEVLPYNMKRSRETDCIDLLAEVETIGKIIPYIDESNYSRVVIYLTAMAAYAATAEDFDKTLTVAFEILLKQKQLCEALRVAMKLGHKDKIDRVIGECDDHLQLKQLAIISFRQRVSVDWNAAASRFSSSRAAAAAEASGLPAAAAVAKDETVQGADDDELTGEELNRLAGGDWLSQYFHALAEELDVMEPKLPENVYKTHLEERRTDAVNVDSAKQNLAATLVNGFVNAGFCNDLLMSPEDSTWLYKNKDHGMLSAAASLGLINLWNVNECLAKVDKLQWSTDSNVKSGAFVAFGLFNAAMRNEWDPAYVLLNEHVESSDPLQKQGAVFGLGLAYTATQRTDLLDSLIPVIVDMSNSTELSAIAALSLGLIFVGSCHEAVTEVLVQTLIDRTALANAAPADTQHTDGEETTERIFLYQLCVALGLVYLGRREACETTLMALEALSAPFDAYAAVTLEGMAYAASGEVLKIQRMLRVCVEDPSESAAEEESPESVNSNRGGSAAVAAVAVAASGGDETDATAAADGPSSSPAATSSSTAATNAPGGSDASATAAAAGDRRSSASAAATTATTTTTSSPIPTSHMNQAAAVLCLPLIAMGETTGTEMVLRLLEHLLQHASLPMRRAIPLALALHSASTPKPAVIDSLSKLSHDPDADVALHAIMALGIVGAGSNNSRIAGLLRRLAAYYGKDANALFTVRIAQGLLYMGKGLLTISPLYSDGFLVDPAGLGSLLVVLNTCLNLRKSILARHHYLLYFLVPSIFPRMLITLDEKLEPLPVTVRVGQAVDVVGQAGHPKTITGFQTHTTPVLLSSGERAELAVDDYVPMSPVLEGVVILRRKEVEVGQPAAAAASATAAAAAHAAEAVESPSL